MELALLGDFDIQRAAILARVSTDDQVKGTSLTSQIEDCRQKAKDSNFLVAESDIYVEEGVSGALPIERRPKLQALFDRAEKGYYQALICYSPDRLSRKTVYQLLYEDEAKSLGCSVIFVTETFDDSPEGEFTKIVRVAVSELERTTITRRTLKGRKASLERGGYSGGSKPFGYNWSKDQGWTIDGNQANIVRQVFQWYVYGGLSLREIARKLNELAIPLPKGKTDSYWSNSQVNVLISQPAYVGVYYGLRGKSHKKFDSIEQLNSFASESGWTLIPNFPAILVDGNGDPNIDLWESAQRKRGANRTGGVGHRTLNWPLQGKIRCAECDHQLRCRQNHSKGKRVYRCHTGRDSYEIGRQKCATPGVAAENIERSVASYLTGALREPDQLEIAAQEYLGVLESRIFELEVAARPLDPDIDEIRSKIKRINRLYIDGDIEEKEHDDLSGPLKEKLDTLVGARGADRPATDQLQCLQDRKNSIAEALKNDSLVAAISSIRGMTLKSARSEEERRANYHNGGSRPGGIAGINARLYKEDLGGLDFDKIINLLSLKVWVYPDSVKIEGLIPLEIPMDNIQPDIPKLSGPTGGSQNSQSPLTDRRRTRPPHGWNVAPDRRPAPTFVAVLDSVPTGNSRSN